MVNATSLYSNKTQVSYGKIENLRITCLTLILSTFSLYLSSVIVILCVLFTTSHIRENVRYLLFCHVLICDSFHFTLAFILFIMALYLVFIPLKYCCIIGGIAATTNFITPYNLALMSLERYVAICFPLRHEKICTVWRCNIAIMLTWAIAAFPVLIELLILWFFTGNSYFSRQTVCVWNFLQIYKVQSTIRFLSFSLSFIMVGLTIIYTYIRVMLVAKKIGSSKSSATKAAKTVLLHAFQLLLCLCSYSNTFTETIFPKQYLNIAAINFFLFSCLPQYISPLIYGIRDEVIRQRIRKLFRST
ncbi:odorant receptor 131-2-like [Bufo gargarizans]|uniref:odorant receptor 131-2-like n=1 Tax=Bufo gargarizans TaxID=30331 RepID=UPI001CF2F0E4|nr:odorant receptor 131-2-like [Bufo gargarizans]